MDQLKISNNAKLSSRERPPREAHSNAFTVFRDGWDDCDFWLFVEFKPRIGDNAREGFAKDKHDQQSHSIAGENSIRFSGLQRSGPRKHSIAIDEKIRIDPGIYKGFIHYDD